MNKKILISTSVIAVILIGVVMYALQKPEEKLPEVTMTPPPTVAATATPTGVEADLNAIDGEGFEADINSINTDIGGL